MRQRPMAHRATMLRHHSPQRLNVAVLDSPHQHNDAHRGVGATAVLIDAAELVVVQTAPKTGQT